LIVTLIYSTRVIPPITTYWKPF